MGNILANFQFILHSPEFRVVLDITPQFDVVLLRGTEHCCTYPPWRHLPPPEWSTGPLHMGMLFDVCSVYTQSGVYFHGLGDGCWQTRSQAGWKEKGHSLLLSYFYTVPSRETAWSGLLFLLLNKCHLGICC